MNPLPSDPYIELCVPDAKTEQEFLRLAVQAAVMKYRETHGTINPPQSTYDEASSLQGGRDGVTHLAMAKTRVLGLDHSTLHDTERREASEGTEATTVTPGGPTISPALETVAYPEKVLPEIDPPGRLMFSEPRFTVLLVIPVPVMTIRPLLLDMLSSMPWQDAPPVS